MNWTSNTDKSLKVWLVSTGTGRTPRGIEVFFQRCFDALIGTEGLSLTLFRGAGEETECMRNLSCLFRDSGIARVLGKFVARDGYVIEQWSSFFPLMTRILQEKPDVIYYGDANIGFLLYRFRSLFRLNYRLLYHNGGPCDAPFVRTHFVQQLSPMYFERAIISGEFPSKHFLVPIGIELESSFSFTTADDRVRIRRVLGIPSGRRVVLSVGWVRSNHKRMDYLIKEVAALPEPRPFLVIIGLQDEGSRPIVELAKTQLGSANFMIRTTSVSAVSDYYRAADIFALASEVEAFGIVFLEALSYGLPTIGHCHPVIKYVLGDAGIVGDLSRPGGLSSLLFEELQKLSHASAAETEARRESVRSRFSWDVLRPAYAGMFHAAATLRMPWVNR